MVAGQDRLQEEYNIGAARLEEFATSPPVEMDSSIGRIQHLEALVAELRRERDDLRSNGAASKRAGEVGPDRSDVVPEALGELPRWITFTYGRGAGRRGPGCRVVSAVGSRRVEAGECKEEMQPTIGDRRREVTRQSRYGLRGVRVGEASNPGPQSTKIVS